MALGPSQPPIQWVLGALSLGIKQLGHEADHSPPPSAEVKNAWSYTSTPQYVFMAWCLVKQLTLDTLLVSSKLPSFFFGGPQNVKIRQKCLKTSHLSLCPFQKIHIPLPQLHNIILLFKKYWYIMKDGI
jgi:hypothetical protein